jgi:hypothetical protein
MFFGWAIALTVLYVCGVYWCYEVIGRLREDLKELREPDENVRKAAIIIIWFITVAIAVILVISTKIIITRFIEFVRGM